MNKIIHESLCKSIKKVLQESNLNRIENFIKNYEVGIISAWRGQLANETPNTFTPYNISKKNDIGSVKVNGEQFTTNEKKFYNRELKAALLRLNYGVTNVRGSYVEEDFGESQEESFFVVNLHSDPSFKENLIKLGEYYNQDSIFYSPQGELQGYLIGTNNSDFPGYGNEVLAGSLLTNVMSQFMSRIGNKGFSFTNGEDVSGQEDENELFYNGDNNYKQDNSPNFIDRKNKRKEQYNGMQESIGVKTYKDYTIKEKHAISLLSRQALNEIKKK